MHSTHTFGDVFELVVRFDDIQLDEHLDDTVLPKLAHYLCLTESYPVQAVDKLFQFVKHSEIINHTRLVVFCLNIIPKYMINSQSELLANDMIDISLNHIHIPSIQCALLENATKQSDFKMHRFKDILCMAFDCVQCAKSSLFVQRSAEELILHVINGQNTTDQMIQHMIKDIKKNGIHEQSNEANDENKNLRSSTVSKFVSIATQNTQNLHLLASLLPIFNQTTEDQKLDIRDFAIDRIEKQKSHDLNVWRIAGCCCALIGQGDNCVCNDYGQKFGNFPQGVIACAVYAFYSGKAALHFDLVVNLMHKLNVKQFLIASNDVKLFIDMVDTPERCRSLLHELTIVHDKVGAGLAQKVACDCIEMLIIHYRRHFDGKIYDDDVISTQWICEHAMDHPNMFEQGLAVIPARLSTEVEKSIDFDTINRLIHDRSDEWEKRDNAIEIAAILAKSQFADMSSLRTVLSQLPVMKIVNESSHFVRYSMIRLLRANYLHLERFSVQQCICDIIREDSDPLPRREAVSLLHEICTRKDIQWDESCFNEISKTKDFIVNDTDTQVKLNFIALLNELTNNYQAEIPWMSKVVIRFMDDPSCVIEAVELAETVLKTHCQNKQLVDAMKIQVEDQKKREQWNPAQGLFHDVILSLSQHVTHVDLDCY